MSSKLRQAIDILQKEGFTELVKRTVLYFARVSYRLVIPIKGRYTQSVDSVDVSFSAPSSTAVKRNTRRFQSEKEEIKDLLDELGKDDVFFDIGANTGLYTLFAAEMCQKVVSVEPYPPNTSILKRDLKRNNISNVDVIELALSNKDGSISFEQPEEDDVGYGSSSIEVNQSPSSGKVPTMTGDSLIQDRQLPVPNVVKIDVEGAEKLVVDGLEETLMTSECRIIYCEVHLPNSSERPSIRDHGSNLNELITQFEEFGFSVEKKQERGTEIFLKGRK